MKVLITRPRSQAGDFAAGLCAAGFEPIFFPVIEIRPIENNTELEQALRNLKEYDWVVFTSVNAVEVVFARVPSPSVPLLERDGDAEGGVRVAAIGPKTAQALQVRGVTPDFVPAEYAAESVLPGLGDLKNKRVLLPCAEIARRALPEAILAAGGSAHEIAVYRTLPAQPDAEGLAALRSGVDWITFASPSAVQNFVEILRRQKMNPFQLAGNPKIACIGPITERAAREEGFEVDLVAGKYTTDGLVKEISRQANR